MLGVALGQQVCLTYGETGAIGSQCAGAEQHSIGPGNFGFQVSQIL
jgi:hypothetical protein